MKFSAVLKWMLFIALAIAIAVGAGGVWLWQNGNSMMRQKLLTTFDKAAPDLELHIQKLELLTTSTAKLSGLEIRDRKTNRPVLRAESLEVALDEAMLIERQQVLLRTLKVSGIDILLRRSSDGRWNWQDYRFVRLSEDPLIPPAVTLEKVRAQVMLEHGEGIPPASLLVSTPLFQAVPASAESYDFTGLLTLPGAGDLSVTGGCDLRRKTWTLGGKLNGMSAG